MIPPPPTPVAALLAKDERSTDKVVPAALEMAPPLFPVFPTKLQSLTVSVPAVWLIAPPGAPAMFPAVNPRFDIVRSADTVIIRTVLSPLIEIDAPAP